MRIPGFILAFYILFLAVIPCCAFDDCPDDIPVQTSQHQQDDKDCGNCSPFFNCEGCANATLNAELPQHEMIPALERPAFTGYIHESLAQVHFDFWQPPRLG